MDTHVYLYMCVYTCVHMCIYTHMCIHIIFNSLKYLIAGVAQWIERQPVNQRALRWIPSQGTCLGCQQASSSGCVRGNDILMFHSLSFSLPSPL